MDIRKIILDRLGQLDMSKYALVKAIAGKVPERTAYDYLAGKSEINSFALAIMLDALKLTIKPK